MKKTRPVKHPDLNGHHAALWDMVDWLADEFKDYRREHRQFMAGLFLVVIAGFLVVVLR